MTSTPLPPLPVPVIEAAAVHVSEGDRQWSYRPAIQWGGATLWESDHLVQGEHGDYNNDQEAKAISIANKHIVTTLKGIFNA